MQYYLILSQAVAVLKVLLKNVDSHLTYIESCEDMDKDKRIEINKELIDDKEVILMCLKFTERLVNKIKDNL